MSKFAFMKWMSLFLIIFLFFSNTTTAQNEIQPIILDRPDLTESPFLTPHKYVQIESGLLYENTDGDYTLTTPTILTKYGVTKNFEIRLITNLTNAYGWGIPPIWVGFKTPLILEKGIIPQVSFIGHIALHQLATKEYKAQYLAPKFRFVAQHTISSKISLSYNAGIEWDENSNRNQFIYTLSTGFQLNPRFGFFVEGYGEAEQINDFSHYADGGFTFLLNKNAMVDISTGMKYFRNFEKYYFFSCGYSFRFNTSQKFNPIKIAH
ncbi:MAG: transporter [Chitinophagaceae bacterium]